jgi:hypothetical protein
VSSESICLSKSSGFKEKNATSDAETIAEITNNKTIEENEKK